MARLTNLVLTAAFVLGAAAPASADTAPTAPPATFGTATTTLGTLLDNPATAPIVLKYLPNIAANAHIDIARTLTLKQIQAYAPDRLTDDMLAKIDADLAQVPAPH